MTNVEVILTVTGDPAPKGSLKCVGRNGHHQLVEDNPHTNGWRKLVAATADNVDDRARPAYLDPVGVEVTLTLERPASHYGTGRNSGTVKASAPTHPTALRTGDVDKLARTILDALEDSGVLCNDAQVVELTARKAWTDCPTTPDTRHVPGAIIRVYPIGEPCEI